MRRSGVRLLLGVCIAFSLLAGSASAAPPNHLVITQVYGGGGNANSTIKNDFIEVFNPTAQVVDLSGYAVGYYSANGTTSQTTALTGTLAPGGYHLVQESSGGANGTVSLVPDDVGNISMAAGSGRVELTNAAGRVDIVSYGSSTPTEGSPTPLLDATKSAKRIDSCVDTDNNAADFATSNPITPRNGSTDYAPCGGAPFFPQAKCGAAISTPKGTAVTQTIKAKDGDGKIVSITGGTLPDGITLGATTPSANAGDDATADLTVGASTEVGKYSVTITATNDDATPKTATCVLRINVTPADGFFPIHSIQGSGNASPYNGDTVKVKGVIVGIDNLNGSSTSGVFTDDKGFFLEAPQSQWDANDNTSEGIFIAGVTTPSNYHIGDHVTVTGLVMEEFGLTEILSNKPGGSVVANSDTDPQPPAITIDPTKAANQTVIPPGSPCSGPSSPCLEGVRSYYEALEDMDVKLSVGVANSGGTSKFDELFLTPGTEQKRLFRTEGGARKAAVIGTEPDAGAGNPPDPRTVVGTSTTLVKADLFDTVHDLQGPLTFSFSNYEIVNQTLPTVDKTGVSYPWNEAPAAVAGSIRYTEFNVENFFAAGHDPEGQAEHACSTTPGSTNPPYSSTCVSQADFDAKLGRVVDAINRQLKRPDVVAVEEVDDIGVLNAVATGLNNASTDGTYTAYLIEGNDQRGIDVGYLIKSTVQASNVRQLGKNELDPDSSCNDSNAGGAGELFKRVPLAIDITAGPTTFTAINNHWSSKGSDPNAVCKDAQATYVAGQVKALEDQGKQVIVSGDLNAYEDESPLTKVLTNNSLFNLWTVAPEQNRYSYAFDGALQTLDHVLVTSGLKPKVTSYAYQHFDNDYYTRPAPDGHAFSDHDPPVAVIKVDTLPTAVNDAKTVAQDSDATAIDVLANDTDPDGGPKTITAVAGVSHGAVVTTGGGTGVTYKPAAGYCGTDSFTYTLNGGSQATVTITVTCADKPPTAVDDAKTVDQDSGDTAIDVLANDTDTDGGPKTITAVDGVSHGSVATTGGGTGLTYKPAAGYCGADAFTYTLNGGSKANVSITVTCKQAPTATPTPDGGSPYTLPTPTPTPPPGATPTPTPKPGGGTTKKPVLKFVTTKLAKLKKGVYSIRISFNQAGSVTLKLIGKVGKKSTTIGTVKKTFTKSQTITLKLKPTKAGLKVIKSRKKVSFTLSATAKPKTGKSITAKKKVTVKR